MEDAVHGAAAGGGGPIVIAGAGYAGLHDKGIVVSVGRPRGRRRGQHHQRRAAGPRAQERHRV